MVSVHLHFGVIHFVAFWKFHFCCWLRNSYSFSYLCCACLSRCGICGVRAGVSASIQRLVVPWLHLHFQPSLWRHAELFQTCILHCLTGWRKGPNADEQRAMLARRLLLPGHVLLDALMIRRSRRDTGMTRSQRHRQSLATGVVWWISCLMSKPVTIIRSESCSWRLVVWKCPFWCPSQWLWPGLKAAHDSWWSSGDVLPDVQANDYDQDWKLLTMLMTAGDWSCPARYPSQWLWPGLKAAHDRLETAGGHLEMSRPISKPMTITRIGWRQLVVVWRRCPGQYPSQWLWPGLKAAHDRLETDGGHLEKMSWPISKPVTMTRIESCSW